MSPSRYAVLALLIASPIGALIACGVGDEISYKQQAVNGDDSGIVRDDAGRLVGLSDVEVKPPANDGGSLPPAVISPCQYLDQDAGEDAGCDPTQGLGCCLPISGVANNACVPSVYYQAGTYCGSPNDLFVACTGSDNDNACCWGSAPNGSVNTRYRSSCDGGIESCDPLADAGTGSLCPNTPGATCTPTNCHGLNLGYCAGSGTTDPCPR